jgi:hypothetical protein
MYIKEMTNWVNIPRDVLLSFTVCLVVEQSMKHTNLQNDDFYLCTIEVFLVMENLHYKHIYIY